MRYNVWSLISTLTGLYVSYPKKKPTKKTICILDFVAIKKPNNVPSTLLFNINKVYFLLSCLNKLNKAEQEKEISSKTAAELQRDIKQIN